MNNIKIGARLGLAFGFVLGLMAAIVVIAITRFAQLNAETTDVVRSDYPNVVIANAIAGHVNLIARSTRNLLLIKEEEASKREAERLAKARQSVSESMEKLAQTIDAGKGREVFGALKEARSAYVVDLDTLLKMVAEKKTDEAVVFMMTKMRATQQNYFDKIAAMVDYQDSLMKQAEVDAVETYHNARWVLLALAGVALVLAGLLGVLVTRSVVQPIRLALQAAQRVAAGDLTSQIEASGKDEVSELLAALKAMNESLHTVVGQVRAGSEGVSTASAEIASGNQDLSAR
ncbi:MAG: MCP four helix bundle domain-containing protein, partial [Rhodoferax sp.]